MKPFSKSVTKALVLGVVLACSGVAFAQDATVASVIARKNLMKAQGGAVKVLGDMAGGKTAFDAAAAEAARVKLAETAGGIEAAFTPNEADPASEASPEVWTNFADFVAKAGALTSAAGGMDTSTVEGVQAGMAGVGGACTACHKAYRM